MKELSTVKRLCLCAMCIALCCVLPTAFHALSLGRLLSPMHIPVLLCGLLCGPWCGAFCGVAGPVLSSLLTGMPSATALISMVPELLTYGLVCGLLMKLVRTRHTALDLYLSMVPAMLLGRVVGGVADALFYLGSGESYTLAMFAGSYFIGALPGIGIQLILIPLLVLALEKTHAIPARYPQA